MVSSSSSFGTVTPGRSLSASRKGDAPNVTIKGGNSKKNAVSKPTTSMQLFMGSVLNNAWKSSKLFASLSCRVRMAKLPPRCVGVVAAREGDAKSVVINPADLKRTLVFKQSSERELVPAMYQWTTTRELAPLDCQNSSRNSSAVVFPTSPQP